MALAFAMLVALPIGLFPNPYMPPMVARAHFIELLCSILLLGAIAGWMLHTDHTYDKHPMGERLNPVMLEGAG